MKKQVVLFAFVAAIAVTLTAVSAEGALIVRLPAGLQAIEEEAFMGDTGIREDL